LKTMHMFGYECGHKLVCMCVRLAM